LFYSLLDEKTKSLNITILFEYKHTVIGGGRHGRLSHEKKKITRDEADDHFSYESENDSNTYQRTVCFSFSFYFTECFMI
jgi:hypothetical protein